MQSHKTTLCFSQIRKINDKNERLSMISPLKTFFCIMIINGNNLRSVYL